MTIEIILLLAWVITTAYFMLNEKKENDKKIILVDKYYFVLKYAIKNLDQEKSKDLLKELVKKYGRF